MKKIFYYFVLVIVFALAQAASAADAKATKPAKPAAAPAVVSATDVAAPPANLNTSARILWLDKQTNKRDTVVLNVGTAQNIGGLQVSLGKCLPDYANQPGQDVAWVEVKDSTGRQTPWFAGWMFSSAPDVATLDHPRYDLQVQGCGDKPRRIGRAASPLSGGGEAAGGADSEAPSAQNAAPAEDATPPETGDLPTAASDSAASTGTVAPAAKAQPAADPYYVPGMEDKQPAQPAATPSAGGADDKSDLHKMMEGGVY